MVSKSELIHYKIQAALREHNIPETELKYMGEVIATGQHMYLVANKHLVEASNIMEFERVDED